MGLTGALIAVAALVGPPTAGILLDIWGANVVFYVDSAFIVITLTVFLLIARDGSPSVLEGESDRHNATRDDTRRNPALWAAYAAAFAITVGIGALVTHLPLMLEEMGETSARSGYSFGIYALVAMLVMASPISRAGDRYGRYGPLMLGLMGIAVGLALLGVLTGYGGVVAGMAVFGLGYGLVFPAATALVAGVHGYRPSWNGLRGSSTPSTRSEWS